MNRSPVPAAAFRAHDHPPRLNLGCGDDYREGFVNVDINAWFGPDVIADVRRLAFLPSAYYAEIVAHDLLEHMPRIQTVAILKGWNRLLQPGGRLSLRVPSLLGLADLLRAPEAASIARQEQIVQAFFGTQAYVGDYHYTSFTEPLLRHYLDAAGFRVLRVAEWAQWMFDVTAEKATHIEAGDVHGHSGLAEVEGDEAFLRQCYARLLAREPDPQGFDYFLNALRHGMDRAGVIGVMLGSSERRELRANGISAEP